MIDNMPKLHWRSRSVKFILLTVESPCEYQSATRIRLIAHVRLLDEGQGLGGTVNLVKPCPS